MESPEALRLASEEPDDGLNRRVTVATLAGLERLDPFGAEGVHVGLDARVEPLDGLQTDRLRPTALIQ